MDQLKPLIKHHYWICFGLSVIFVVVGWWLASGNIAEATATRKSSVEDSFSKAKQGGDAPNARWIEAAKKENELDAQAYGTSSKSLWLRQKNARIWPDDLAAEMKGIPYFEPIPNPVTRGKWGAGYGSQFDKLLEIIKPFQIKDGTGLVVVNKNRITHKPYNSWRIKAPLSDEVWKNQEDLWLLKCLLTSLARVNEGANRITEASLREIVALKLRGGDPEAKPAAAGGGGGMMGGGMGGMGGFGGGGGSSFGGGEDAGGSGGMGMMGAMGGGAATPGSGPWKAFEGTFGMDLLSEEFGSVGGAGAGGMMGMMGGGSGESPGMSLGGFGGGGGPPGAMGGAVVEADRYVHKAEDLPYKTRAFFLHVKVREEQVARLLAELTNSDFPVEIVRVDLKTFGGSAGSSGGGLMSGGPGGGSMGLGMGGGDMGMSMGGGDMGMSMGGSGYGGEMGDDGYGDSLSGGLGSGEMGDAYDPGAGYGDDTLGGNMYGGEYGSNTGMPGLGSESQTGKQTLAAAMLDANLIEVRIAGLMTLYQSQEETEAQNETEAAAAEETAENTPGMPSTAEESPESTTPDDTSMTGDKTKIELDSTGSVSGEQSPPATSENDSAPASEPNGDAIKKDSEQENGTESTNDSNATLPPTDDLES